MTRYTWVCKCGLRSSSRGFDTIGKAERARARHARRVHGSEVAFASEVLPVAEDEARRRKAVAEGLKQLAVDIRELRGAKS